MSRVLAILFLALNALAVAARYPPGDHVVFGFSLRNETHVVLQGGGDLVANPFHALSETPFSIDLVKLKSCGNRAKGLSPRALTD